MSMVIKEYNNRQVVYDTGDSNYPTSLIFWRFKQIPPVIVNIIYDHAGLVVAYFVRSGITGIKLVIGDVVLDDDIKTFIYLKYDIPTVDRDIKRFQNITDNLVDVETNGYIVDQLFVDIKPGIGV